MGLDRKRGGGEIIKCPICGKEAYFCKSDKRKYCSKQCSDIALSKPIPKDELIKLYLEDNLSQCKIAEIYKVSTSSIARWMAVYGIPVRDSKGRTIICSICGKERYIPKNLIEKGKGKYCSKKCGDIGKAKDRVKISWDKIKDKFGVSVEVLLTKLFFQEHLNISEVAQKVGTDRNTIYRWCELLKIEIPEYDHNKTMQKFFSQMTEEERKHFTEASHQAIKDKWKNPQFRARRIEESRERLLKNNHLLQHRKEPTSIEAAIYNGLDELGVSYCKQYIVGNKFACDVAFPELRIIIEIQGDYWHGNPKKFKTLNEQQKRQQKQDRSKKAYLEACGFKVLYIWESDIKNNLTGCLNKIIEVIKKAS